MNTCRTEQSAFLYLRCTLVRRGFLWDMKLQIWSAIGIVHKVQSFKSVLKPFMHNVVK